MSTNKVKPELAAGFRDYLPSDMLPRNQILKKIQAVFERFGFLPMDTPGLEKSEVLGKEDSDFLIYRAGLEGEQDLALRYDLTVPLARVIAANADKLAMPFKRYQFGRVWRGEKAQTGKGRWREFTQLDIDTVGASGVTADAEIVAVMYETLCELGLEGNFIIKVNNRKLLSDLPVEALRIIDKKDKAGEAAVESELKDLLSAEQMAVWGKIKQNSARNSELDELLANARLLGVPESALEVDNSIIRGLGYYTGNIFEAKIPGLPEFGSIFSGGRYDGLVSRFAPFTLPAVGASVGVDRVFSALDQLGKLERVTTTAKVLLLNFSANAAATVQSFATRLRRDGIAAEIYLGDDNSLKGQLTYAIKREFLFAIIIGDEELNNGNMVLRDLTARTQKAVSADEALSELKLNK